MGRNRLSFKFALYVFIIFSSLGVLSSLVSAVSTRRNELESMDRHLRHVSQSHLPAVINSLRFGDYDEAVLQVESIALFRYCTYVELFGVDGLQITAGKKGSGMKLVFEEQLRYMDEGAETLAGQIFIYFDQRILQQTVRNSFIFLAAMLVASSMGLSVIIYLIFNNMVGKHIRRLSGFLIRDRVEMLDTDFSFERKTASEDEMAMLADSINMMRGNLRDYIRKEGIMKETLEKEVSLRNHLFMIISHDLRSPVSGIRGLTEILLDDPKFDLGMKARRIVGEINRAAGSMTMLVENLLHWVRAEQSGADLRKETFRLSGFPDDIIQLFSTVAAEKEIRLDLSCDENIEVTADRQMIETILRNILSNAIKFTPAGGLVRISCRTEEGRPVISIRDNGPGISREVLTRLENGETIESTRGTAGEKGTGMGLSICRQMARLNDAELKITAEEGKGTEIRIIFNQRA